MEPEEPLRNPNFLGQVALARPRLGQQIPDDPSTWRVSDLRAWLDKVTAQLEVRSDCVFESPELDAAWASMRTKAQWPLKTFQLARLAPVEVDIVNTVNRCLAMEPGEWKGRFTAAIDEYLDEFQAARDAAERETPVPDTPEEPSDNTLLTVGGIGVAAALVAALVA